MDDQNMQVFADQIADYIIEKRIKPLLSGVVRCYMATVTTTESGGVIGVSQPFDNQVFIPCSQNAQSLNVGESCAVLVLGDFSNQIAIGKIANL
ncbi:MAG: hypothetical protein J6V82_01435 [Clostridia bacterium]|nr:hypothetical protein [Clostridia bacterium]